MKLYRVKTLTGPSWAVEEAGQLFPVHVPPTLHSDGTVRAVPDYTRSLGPVANAALLAPADPGKIIAIGANYLDHVRETGMTPPPAPLIFAKFPNTLTGPDAVVEIDEDLTERVDWEVELALVIGRRMRNVSSEEALQGVLGYTIANDLSARDVQFGDGQWVRGKSFDGFCPLGPALVTAEELGDPQSLAMETRVNGETVQRSNTSEMLFGLREIVTYCARNFTLEPGDLILTGTPWGCGEFMTPRRSLAPGDRVELEIEGLGVLQHAMSAAARVQRIAAE